MPTPIKNENGTKKTAVDCDTDPNSISAERAQQLIEQSVLPISQTECVATRAALGRIAAADIKSGMQVPNHTNSAMDGYALRGGDLPTQGTKKLQVLGSSLAGRPFHGKVGVAQCVRIMTGAVLPSGTDSVVMQERVEVADECIIVPAGEPVAANVRYAGEDLAVGDVAIVAGQRLTSSHLGIAASLGFSELPVVRHPRVAFFSTGDELRAIGGGGALEIGEVYDSNRYTLYGMLSDMGVEMVDMGIIADDAEAIGTALTQAAAGADMVITSAGASVGEADYVEQTMRRIGNIHFWKVAIKPGRPLAFGALRDCLFFGLPGNPVSVMVTFQIFVKPALRQLAGESVTAPLQFPVKTLSALKKRRGRAEYQRGILSTDPNDPNSNVVRSTGEQGSGMLTSMGNANCFIILPTESTDVAVGELVTVQPFS